MTLSKSDIQTIGQDEETRWKKTHSAIVKEIGQTLVDFEQDQTLARDLTAQIVASRRDEDKAALASDEAVAHGLSSLRKEKTQDLESLLTQPYFARVITEENGRKVEFRLGTASFPAERIIDWRKAPISKLYYDYKEGDEFDETIQGKLREGTITLRRSYQGVEDKLEKIETAQGVLVKNDEGWALSSGNDSRSRKASHDGRLPPILTLITPEQFGLITSDPEKPLMIQGIAGSGKTTVALHRLAWLLHESNSDAKPNNCLVVLLSPTLKSYIHSTLPELEVHGVPILTYKEWLEPLTFDLIGARPRGNFVHNPLVESFKSSTICVELLDEFVRNQLSPVPDSSPAPSPSPSMGEGLRARVVAGQSEDDGETTISLLLDFFSHLTSRTDMPFSDWEKVRNFLADQVREKKLTPQDDTLLLHIVFAKNQEYPAHPGLHTDLDHLVIDEAQDFGGAEIKALLHALKPGKSVTLVGDAAQKIDTNRQFAGWQHLLKTTGFANVKPLPLNVSHRTTQEIMEIASHVRTETTELSKSTRRGPVPSLIQASDPEVLPLYVSSWVSDRLKEDSRTYSAVLCRTEAAAKNLHEQLMKLGVLYTRLGNAKSFDFSPGVTITSVDQVKGLEFKSVLIVEPTQENYNPQNALDRNLLYVAITRAEVQLDFVASSEPTPLLPELPIANDEVQTLPSEHETEPNRDGDDKIEDRDNSEDPTENDD